MENLQIQIKMYRAGNGDAFLLRSIGSQQFAILVDGGYAATYREEILPDLKALAAEGYQLDLLVATHIDADHVSGLLPLLRENGQARVPQIIPIRRVLHNSLRSLNPIVQEAAPVAPRPNDAALLNEIACRGFPMATSEAGNDHAISARQGSSLATLLREGGYVWNQGDGQEPVHGGNSRVFHLGTQGKVTILGPPETRLEALRNWWVSEMRRLGYIGKLEGDQRLDDAFEFLGADPNAEAVVDSGAISLNPDEALSDCYSPDSSVTNSSSITMLVEIGATRVVMLGDAWAEDAETAICRLSKGDNLVEFDAIKVSHHGSLHNTSPALLKLIDAPVYLVSSNGEGHGHPDFPLLKAIVDRPSTKPRVVYFNYPTPASQRLRAYTSAAGAPFSVREGARDWISLPLHSSL